MSERKRLFIAVRFSDEVIASLDRLEGRLRDAVGSLAKVKWVQPHNIHLTMQFLGDVDTALIPKLSGGLSGAYLDVQPFEVTLAGVGCFPNPRKPRVVWAGIQHGTGELKTIHACTLRVTEPLGFERENRPFRVHVTLGRIRDPRRSRDISGALEKVGSVEVGKCQIDAVHLVASELRPSGPIYTTLDSFSLGR